MVRMSSEKEVIRDLEVSSNSDTGSVSESESELELQSESQSDLEDLSIFEEATQEYKKIIVGLSASVKMLKGFVKVEAKDLVMPNGQTLGSIVRGAIGPNFGLSVIKSLTNE
jgi:hypothetical protein